jgi:glycosyltransferase involved in cell wall biosynthesis
MRVALVTSNAPAGNAIGNQVAEKLAFFLDRGAEVRVLLESMDRMHPDVRPHAQVMAPKPEGEGWDYLAGCDLACFEYGQYYPLLGLLPLLHGSRPRVLIDYHGITPPELWSGHNREALTKGCAYRGLVWNSDLTLVHSRAMESELIRLTGVPADRLCRIGFPLDLQEFFPAREENPWRRKLGLCGTRNLLFVGRLAPNKRADMLVEVLAPLDDPKIHALIVGDTSDMYQEDAEKCRQMANSLGVGERVHFLGHLTGPSMRAAYQAADILVVPSQWESFSIPVIEAMACGVPVIATRAFALPETVGDAGLTFRVDDVDDLARQIRRVLAAKAPLRRSAAGLRVGVVSFRYGTDIVGGAEWSLRRIAHALHGTGHAVEVFTTCNREENNWSNDWSEGTIDDDGIPVHRFRIDEHDRPRHLDSVRRILEANGRVPPEVEREYLAHSIHSTRLLEALGRRREEFDVLIAGPYLFGLTADVARAFPEKTLLLPCFHDEPVARLALWNELYEPLAGIMFHSIEEQELAQAELGINNPRSHVIGTWIEMADGPITRSEAGRHVVYCGRYSEQKNLPLLLDWARRYAAEHPERFRFVFIGRGEVAIPDEPWACDLGFVSEDKKREILAGADALIQLSRNESLSLVALEAWSLATPLIAARQGAVLAGHVERSQGGALVSDFAGFAEALDGLWNNADEWRERGLRGREYIRMKYGSRAEFTARLQGALGSLSRPLAEQMRCQGLARAARFERGLWRERFGVLVETLLHEGPSPHEQIEVTAARERSTVSASAGRVLLPLRVANRGTRTLVPDGPGRTIIYGQVMDSKGRPLGPRAESPLPGVLLPGQVLPAALAIAVPEQPGNYHVFLWCRSARKTSAEDAATEKPLVARMDLCVKAGRVRDDACCQPQLDAVQAALIEAERLRHLPDQYLDVTEGRLAPWKKLIKRKLLNNFKHAYVDVLSRQQSAFNQQLVAAVQQLTEACATLDHAVRGLQDRLARLENGMRSPAEGKKGRSRKR